jgi:hypothetical protein
MKRELKFKAYHPERGVFDVFQIDKHIITSSDFVAYYTDECEIMEFSGQNDKNGVDIYEGLRILHNGKKYEVVFEDGAFMLKHGDKFYRMSRTTQGLEVIGTIYDQNKKL